MLTERRKKKKKKKKEETEAIQYPATLRGQGKKLNQYNTLPRYAGRVITTGNLVTDLSDHFPNFISIKGSRFDNMTKP